MKEIGTNKRKLKISEIIKLPLNDFREVWLVRDEKYLSISREGNLTIDRGKFLYNQNDRTSFKEKMILGTFEELKSGNVKVLAKLDKYIKDNEIDTNSKSNQDYLLDVLELSDYILMGEDGMGHFNTVIILDKPSKKLTGKKHTIKVDIFFEDFDKPFDEKSDNTNIIDLEVYSTPPSEDGTDVSYSAYIPANLYKAAMMLSNVEKRPKNRVITYLLQSQLKERITEIANDVYNSKKEEHFRTTESKKYIYIYHKNTKIPEINSYNFGFVGFNTLINFRYFIGYEFPSGIFKNETSYYVTLHKWDVMGGVYNGSIKKEHVMNRNFHYVRVEWSQEREDFLKKLEENFDTLRDKLDNFLGDMNNETIDKIITNNNFKLLNSSE
jgi:hypothetical protein